MRRYHAEFLSAVRERITKRAELLYYEEQGVDIDSLAIDVALSFDSLTFLRREQAQLEACRMMLNIPVYNESINNQTVLKTVIYDGVQSTLIHYLFFERSVIDLVPLSLGRDLCLSLIHECRSQTLYNLVFCDSRHSPFLRQVKLYEQDYLAVVCQRAIIRSELLYYYEQQGVDVAEHVIRHEYLWDVEAFLGEESVQLEACRHLEHVTPFNAKGHTTSSTVARGVMKNDDQARIINKLFIDRHPELTRSVIVFLLDWLIIGARSNSHNLYKVVLQKC